MPEPLFTAKTLGFLRALKRHNDREWFRARREEYDAYVRGPMIALVEWMGAELASFAPDLTASPKQSLYRIYRDTRFSADKSPLKTHAAAIFPCRGLPRHEGAGFYFELSANHALIAGGIYGPQPAALHAIREHLAANFSRFRSIVESRTFQRAFGEVDGERLQRVPRGFERDHPAADFLKFKQFLVAREYQASFACDRRFPAELLARFRQMAPLVRFLNEPLLARARPLDSSGGPLG